jgi:hypothetical protein
MSNNLTPWFKSSYSGGNGGSCVEVRGTGEAVEVRDTKDRQGGTLRFTPDEWRAFIAGVKDGEFNL